MYANKLAMRRPLGGAARQDDANLALQLRTHRARAIVAGRSIQIDRIIRGCGHEAPALPQI